MPTSTVPRSPSAPDSNPSVRSVAADAVRGERRDATYGGAR
jgi:hypothetical protein